MASLKLPIVGSHFHPPAKLLLSLLPSGCPLILDPQPDNPYDPNAVSVLVASSELPIEALQQHQSELLGFGTSVEDLIRLGNAKSDSPPCCWLGFLPMSGGKTALGGPGNVEALEFISTTSDWSATLTFALDSRPRVRLASEKPGDDHYLALNSRHGDDPGASS